GKYHLIASLGQGGMAKVYLALLAGPLDFNKLLVIKIMRQDVLTGSEENARMFWAEARLAARLLHPNIVHTHEVGEQDGRCFLAMEYLDGQPLSAVLNRARAGREIPLDELVRVLSEIARGLHYAHRLQGFQGEDLHVVHRDVSPQNVIVTYGGHGKLVDFGIAKTNDGEQTQLGLVKGKLDYIAPEQLRGEPVDARADVFALGAMVWEVVSGQRFAGGRKVSDVHKVQARLSAGERRLRSVKPDVPAELEGIVERALAMRPEDRFQDAAALADALDAYLERENLRPNPRLLAERLDRLFASERAEMHKLIDRQIKLVKSEREGDERASETTSTDTRKRRAGYGLYVADSHQDERSAIRTAATAARASTVAPPSKLTAALAWKLGALIVAATVAALWLTSRAAEDGSSLARGSRDEPTSAPLELGAAAEAVPSAADAQAGSQAPQSARLTYPAPGAGPSDNTVTIRLKVTPPQAHVLIDGVRVSSPFQGSFRKDTMLHHLDVSAEGFRPAKEFVPFDRDRALEIDLDPAHIVRRGARLDQLIERAAQTVEQRAEPAQPAPATPATESPRQAPQADPVMERPNPYSAD
ncbi:MAG: serine/threonine protein kinase, partial [Myxococcaceae bacterium]|nr:serine/threonine protein kinase [Myxococcaceae bacterium]